MKFLKDLLSAGSFLSLAASSSPLISGTGSELQSRQTSLITCLKDANVPYFVQTSANWTEYVTPFNLRLQYVPAAITLPTETLHVYDSVVCASKAGVKVQAKSGGHSYASFSSGGQNGSLIVDLENFNGITVDSCEYFPSLQKSIKNLSLAKLFLIIECFPDHHYHILFPRGKGPLAMNIADPLSNLHRPSWSRCKTW